MRGDGEGGFVSFRVGGFWLGEEGWVWEAGDGVFVFGTEVALLFWVALGGVHDEG